VSRWSIRIVSEEARAKARKWLGAAPIGMTVEFRQATRSTEQNALLWQRLSDLSEQVTWAGQKLSAEDWKAITTASLRKCRFVPGIDPGTVVPLGLSTSSMTKGEFNELLALIDAFGAEHGVKFKDHQEDAA
jgi:hypothetical protein